MSSVMQFLEILGRQVGDLMQHLAEDVHDELAESFPEELNRTPLRQIRFPRPNLRERSHARRIAVRKFVHLSAMQRYERAQFHAQLLAGTLRMLDFMLLEHSLILAQSAVVVRRPTLHAACIHTLSCVHHA
jgi:hypothetical protein